MPSVLEHEKLVLHPSTSMGMPVVPSSRSPTVMCREMESHLLYTLLLSDVF